MLAMDLVEAIRNLEACLSEEAIEEYNANLRQTNQFSNAITIEEFVCRVMKLITTQEQNRWHNNVVKALYTKVSSSTRMKGIRSTPEASTFEYADFLEYVPSADPNSILPDNIEVRSASSELFVPDQGFISSRISLTAWENGLVGADDGVTELMVHACQVYVKNILMAMISRIKGFKIRDDKFQYGFNKPIPNPFLRNYINVADDSQESKVTFSDGDLIPKCRPCLSLAEQETAFAYAASNPRAHKSGHSLSLRLLYETLRDNPKLLGFHSVQSVNFIRLGMIVDDDVEENDEDENVDEDF